MTKKLTAIVLAAVLLFGGMQTQAYAKGTDSWEDVSAKCGRKPFVRMEIPEALESIDAVGIDQFEGGLKEESRKDVQEWERYGSKLVYNRLTGSERAFWDKLSELAYCYLLEGKDASDFGSWCGSDWVSYEGIDRERAKNILYMFLLSNPQFYFFQPGYAEWGTQDTPGLLLLIGKQFANGKGRAEVTEEFRQKINSWVAKIEEEKTVPEKEIAIHDMICNKVSYDYAEDNILENQTAYSVFFTDATVCAGYSQAMQLLCNAVKIPCASITNEIHQWNLVRIYDTWYYTDLTWDDDVKGPLYRYFNRSMEVMLELEDGLSGNAGESHIPHSYWEEYLPASTKDSGADWEDAGTVYVPEEKTVSPGITIEDGKVLMESSADADIYYTIDQSSPSVAISRAFYYTGSFEVEPGTVVSAIAAQDGYWDSEIVSAESKKTEPEPEPEPEPKPEPDPTPDPVTDPDSITKPVPVPKPDSASQTDVYEAVRTVKLNANGGYIGEKSVKSKVKTVNYGDVYGSLPAAKRKGYAFLGWFTKKNGGSRVTAQDTVTITEDREFYARYCKIAPKKASFASVKSNAPGKLVLRIKDSKIASGYQIRYSRKSSMASAKMVKTQECKTQIAELKKGKKYYVQVRMYQKDSVNGKISYGKWSKKAGIRIKK